MDEREWGDLLGRFQEHLKAEKSLAPLTVRNYRTDLAPLYDFIKLRQIGGIRALDKTTLRAYLAWLIELGYVRPSIVRKLSVLRSFLRWLVRHQIIEADPLPKRGVMRSESRLPRFLSQEDAARLVGAPETSEPLGIRDRALLELIYAAGLRVSEAHDLDVGDLDLGSRELMVTGKGSKQRVVLIGRSASRRPSRSTCNRSAPSWPDVAAGGRYS